MDRMERTALQWAAPWDDLPLASRAQATRDAEIAGEDDARACPGHGDVVTEYHDHQIVEARTALEGAETVLGQQVYRALVRGARLSADDPRIVAYARGWQAAAEGGPP